MRFGRHDTSWAAAAAMALIAASTGAAGATELQRGPTAPASSLELGTWSGSGAADASPMIPGMVFSAPGAATAVPSGLRLTPTPRTETEPADLIYFTPGGSGLGAALGTGDTGFRVPLPRQDFGEDATTAHTAGVAAGYQHRLGGVTLGAGAGFVGTHAAPGVSGLSGTLTDALRLGGGLAFDSLRLGGYYESVRNDFGAAGATAVLAKQRGFDLGASYDIGPFTTGLNWSRAVYRDLLAAGSDKGSTVDNLMLSLSYRLGSNIDLVGALQYEATDNHNGSAAKPDGGSGAFVFGTAIRF